jgi:hypothetical protein
VNRHGIGHTADAMEISSAHHVLDTSDLLYKFEHQDNTVLFQAGSRQGSKADKERMDCDLPNALIEPARKAETAQGIALVCLIPNIIVRVQLQYEKQ